LGSKMREGHDKSKMREQRNDPFSPKRKKALLNQSANMSPKSKSNIRGVSFGDGITREYREKILVSINLYQSLLFRAEEP
jgi:hypothetical protein